MGDKDVEHLLSPESGIVRHKGKILSAIHNAQLVLGIQKEYGSLAAYLWGMMPNKAPINNTYKCVCLCFECSIGLWLVHVRSKHSR